MAWVYLVLAVRAVKGRIAAIHRFAGVARHRILLQFLENSVYTFVDAFPETLFPASFHYRPSFEEGSVLTKHTRENKMFFSYGEVFPAGRRWIHRGSGGCLQVRDLHPVEIGCQQWQR